MQVTDSVVVVSGGASGLGEATTRRLLELGARGVAVLDLNAERGRALAAELGDRLLFEKVDVTDEAGVDAAVAAARARFGAVHAMVAAAGVAGPAKLIGKRGPIPMDRFDHVLKVNLYGTVHLMRAVVSAMLQNDPGEDGERGVLVLVSSGAAYEGQVGQLAYSASKAALVGMTLPLARELDEHGVRVVTVAVGAFDTPIYATVPPSVREGLIASSVFPKRLGHPTEFALFVEELMRNPMHNGRTYRFDAGITLPTRG
jgi:NAD(P)-dependent dehydrogenase (short-subunit alcohol dehydrogenase family)